MFLASSVFFAIYDAVSATRKEEGLTGHFRFDSPATAEKIRMACVDKFTKQVSFLLAISISFQNLLLKFFVCLFVFSFQKPNQEHTNHGLFTCNSHLQNFMPWQPC